MQPPGGYAGVVGAEQALACAHCVSEPSPAPTGSPPSLGSAQLATMAEGAHWSRARLKQTLALELDEACSTSKIRGKETPAMPFYERGDVRIRYEEVGGGFPLLVTPGGGLNSRVSNWPTAVINAMEAFKDDFRCITMDQRNANGGESTGPIAVDDPWGAFADDQLGLMDHLGHPRVLLHGLLHWRLLRSQAHGTRP